MIEAEVLADRLQAVATRVRSEGPVAWERVDDWTCARMPAFREPLIDDEEDERVQSSRSAIDEEDRKGDAAAARYKSELQKITGRLVSDIARLETILGICCPPNPRHLASMELLQAQVESEGYCGSCWRADQEWVEAEKGRYRGRCRWCGDWRAAEGSDPPRWLVAKHHQAGPGGRLTTDDLEKARTGKKAS